MSSNTRPTRRDRGRPVVPIDLSQVKHNSTCITLCLPSSLACQNCANEVCILTNKRKKRIANERQRSPRNHCLQYWTNKWTENSLASAPHLATHNKVRAYLGIEKNVIIEHYSFYELNDSINNSSQKRKLNDDNISNEHERTVATAVASCTSNTSTNISPSVQTLLQSATNASSPATSSNTSPTALEEVSPSNSPDNEEPICEFIIKNVREFMKPTKKGRKTKES